MLYQVCYSTKAMADVKSILAWFDAQGANEAGDRWFIQLYAKIDSLKNNRNAIPSFLNIRNQAMRFVNSYMAAEPTNIALSFGFIRIGFLFSESGIGLAVDSTSKI